MIPDSILYHCNQSGACFKTLEGDPNFRKKLKVFQNRFYVVMKIAIIYGKGHFS